MDYGDKTLKHNRSVSIIDRAISEFLLENRIPGVFLTIHSIEMVPRSDVAKIYISVFPDIKKESAERWLVGNQRKCVSYMREHSNLKFIPRIRFAVFEENNTAR